MYSSVRPSTNTGMLMPSSDTTVTSAVGPALGVAGGEAAERDAHPGGEDHRRHRELDRGREPDQELVEERLVVDDARPEVPLQQAADVVRYCCHRGWSSPRYARIAATRSGVACWPRMAVAGSPGRRWTNANRTIDSPNSTGMAPSMRRTMYLSIGARRSSPVEACGRGPGYGGSPGAEAARGPRTRRVRAYLSSQTLRNTSSSVGEGTKPLT